MPTPDTFWMYASTISIYLVVLFLPGGVLGAIAGLRGWMLAGLAPLLTYSSLGLAGPWLSKINLPFNPATVAATTLLLGAILAGVRWLTLRHGWCTPREDRARPSLPWGSKAHLAVAACVVLAAVLSVVVVLSAAGGPSAVFQRWDSVFHANGIRYIAETGDGSLFGMGTINAYPTGSFYPNGYHLVGALVYVLSGAAIPTVLNAITVPIAGVFALALVTVVRQFNGRAVFAGCAAIVAGTATTGVYESVSSGLLPFALGIVLTPLAVVVVDRFLRRPAPDTGAVLALSAVGLLAVHSSALFGAALFTLPMLVQRWWRARGQVARRALRDVGTLLPVGVVAVLLAAPHLLGALGFVSGSYPYDPWEASVPVPNALQQLLTFRQVLDESQVWLAVLLVLGVIGIGTLGRLRWLGLSALVMSSLFVLVASFGGLDWVIVISRPWWNDRYRMMALAAIPLCLLAAHGMAEAQRMLAKLARSVRWVQLRPKLPERVGLASAVLLVSMLAVLTNGFYTAANATAVGKAYNNGPLPSSAPIPVTADEVAAMLRLGELADPDDMVLNDRMDGTAWVYAIAGVRPVAGHYDAGLAPVSAELLANHFNDYEANAAVREAVEELNVRWVLLGSGSINAHVMRAPGLRGLADEDFVREVYRNPDAVIYRVTA